MEKLTCSICGGNLLPGRVAVRKSIAAKLQWPFPSDRLFFKPQDETQKSETVLREGVSHRGYKCENCRAVLVTRERWNS